MDPGPRWIYGFTVGAVVSPVGLSLALALLWEFRAAWCGPPSGDDLRYFGPFASLIAAGVVLLIPAALLGGWACGRAARWSGRTRRCT